jgi:hypothetical protein
MKRLLQLFSLLLIAGVVVVSQAQRPELPDDVARAGAIKLYQSMNDEQKKLAVLDFANKDKYREDFPAVERKGVPFSNLTADQKKMVDEIVGALTSSYGAERCREVGKQTPDNRRYVTFYGEPDATKPFAWRVAQHHLTLIYAQFGSDPTKEFGPILLGGNPVKTLWDEEEKIALALYAALSPEEAKNIQGKGGQTSGQPIGKNGLRIGDLNGKARDLAKQLLAKRLDVFSRDRRKALEKFIEADGGPDGLRIAVWGEMTKKNLDGGNYHWRIGGPSIVCDWQTAGKNHLHMTVRGKQSS